MCAACQQCSLSGFIALIILISTSFALVNGVSVEKDLSMTLKEKQILDKFKEQVTPLLYQNYMKSDIYLIRWLRARNFNVEDAERMLKEVPSKYVVNPQNIKWRRENKIDQIQQEDFADMWQEAPGTVDTYDKEGRPIITIEIYDWDIRQLALAGKGPRLLRYIDMLMDNVTRQVFERQQNGMNVTQWKCLVNADNFNMIRHGCPACIPLWIQFLYSNENHFAGWLDEFIVIEATFAVQTMISTLRPFLSQHTRDAIITYSNRNQWMAYLDQRVSREERRLPYGGTKL